MNAEDTAKPSLSRTGTFFVGLVLVATIGLSGYHIVQMKRLHKELDKTKQMAEEMRKSSMLNKGEANQLRQEFEELKKKITPASTEAARP